MAVDTPAKIAILGGGPSGIEAGLYARYLGYQVTLFERERLAHHVLQQGNERLPYPFRLLRSTLGLAALKAQNPAYQTPADDAYLNGHEWVDRYLLPVARSDLLSDQIQLNANVVAVSRGDVPCQTESGEAAVGDSTFRVWVQDRSGQPSQHAAHIVLDTTGIHSTVHWRSAVESPSCETITLRSRIEHRDADADSTANDEPSLLTTEPGCYFLGARNVERASEFHFATALQQIRALFAIIGGREDLDLYESVQNLL